MTSTSGILSPDALEKIYKKLERRDQATVTALITSLASTSGENEEHAFVASSGSGEGVESKAAEMRKSKRGADEMDHQTGHENASTKRPALHASKTLSVLESLPVDSMVNVCEFLDLPTRWRLSRCNKTLEKFITADCIALWRHIVVRSAGVREMTDETIAAIFEKVNARDVTLTLDLERCLEISGRCLEPLRHSRVLESISFPRALSTLEYGTVEDILRTMIPHHLRNVKLPTPSKTDSSAVASTNFFFRELHESNLRSMGLSCKHCAPSPPENSHVLKCGVSGVRHCEVQGLCERCRCKEELTPSDYMEKQPEINAALRAILVDWLIQVHDLGHRTVDTMAPETLYVAINLIDRYLQQKGVARSKLQLVGIASLLIASKHVEIYMHSPLISDITGICADSYTPDEAIGMEQDILETLEGKIVLPTAHDFLVCFQRAARADKRTCRLSSYVLDGTLLSYDLNEYVPSQLAAAAISIARQCVGLPAWSSSLVQQTKCSEEEVASVARDILSAREAFLTIAEPQRPLAAVIRKYIQEKYGGVAYDTLPLLPIPNNVVAGVDY